MSIATCTLPAANAPPMTEISAAPKIVHLRPILLAVGPAKRPPRHAPKKKRALTAPMIELVYAAPGPFVESLKYSKKPGWPMLVAKAAKPASAQLDGDGCYGAVMVFTESVCEASHRYNQAHGKVVATGMRHDVPDPLAISWQRTTRS